MNDELKVPLQAARHALKEGDTARFDTAEPCPLPVIGLAVAAYLSARRKEMAKRHGEAVGFALDDEIAALTT